MIDEKAAAYAKEHASDGDVLKIYEAYKDGYLQGDNDSTPAAKIIAFVFIGIILGIYIMYFLLDAKLLFNNTP